MNCVKFDKLTTMEKASLIQHFGIYMMSVSDGQYGIALFALDSTLVELYYDWPHKEIARISLASYPDLDKFIEHIRLA